MNKDDYQNKIEEHRKPIELTTSEAEVQNTRKSRRSNAAGSKKTKPKRNYLLPVLFFFFILIPVSFLIYVFVFYQPSSNDTAIVDDSQFQYEQNDKGDVADTSSEDENTDSNPTEGKTADSEPQEEPTDTEDTTEPETTEPEIQPVVEPEEPSSQEPVPTENETDSERTHVVQPGENLYRIALKYFPSGNGVELIKSANNLPSDSISSGQTLIIPK